MTCLKEIQLGPILIYDGLVTSIRGVFATAIVNMCLGVDMGPETPVLRGGISNQDLVMIPVYDA